MYRLHCLLPLLLGLLIAAEAGRAQEAPRARDAAGMLRSVESKLKDAVGDRSQSATSPAIRSRITRPRPASPSPSGSQPSSESEARPQRTAQVDAQAGASSLETFGLRQPAAFSTSGRFLVGSEPDGSLLVCDVANRRRLRRLEDSSRRYSLIAMSADARWIVGLRADNSAQIDLWRADNGRMVRTILAEKGPKRSVEFSERGDELRVMGADGEGVVYSIPAGVSIGGFASQSGSASVKVPTVQAPRMTLSPRETAKSAAPPPSDLQAPPPLSASPDAPHSFSGVPESPSSVKSFAAPKSAMPSAAAPAASPQAPQSSIGAAAPRIAAPQAATAAPEADAGFAPPSAAPQIAAPSPAPTFRMERQEPAAAAPTMAAPSFEPQAAPMAAPMAAAPETQQFETAPPAAAESFESFAIEAEPAEPAMAPPESALADDGPPQPASAGDVPETAAEVAAADQASDSAVANALADVPPEDLSSVTVHYATNRNRLAGADRAWLTYFTAFFSSLPAFVIYALVLVAVLVFPWFGKRSWATMALVSGALLLCAMGSLEAYVRSQLRDELSGELFGSHATDLSYGSCQISVPRPENRQAGELNRPVSVWILEAPENPEKHFVLQKVQEHADKDAFYQSLSSQLAKSTDGVSLLFIHGYNVSFEDAIFRTAQLAVDLKFPGAPITFSWPSSADPLKYTFDEQNAEASIPALREVLEDLATRSGARRIHIIAHSMGNRVLAGAMRSMPVGVRETNKQMFREVVLAAPDIDSRVFTDQILPHINENAQHCTLYASNRDRALLMSRYFHNYQRLGETEPELIVASGMDTIDASLVDTSLLGHSYIGDVQSIVSDLRDLVVLGMRPKERGGLETLLMGSMMYWTIKPLVQTANEEPVRR
jgi:esterase/lipase superfamily enzyme